MDVEQNLGKSVGKGKVGSQVLDMYRETVAPKVMQGVMKAVMRAVLNLPEEHRNAVLEEMGAACYEEMKQFVGEPPANVDIETACHWLNDTVPHDRRFQRAGDTVYWEASVQETYGGCMCFLVQLGILDPNPALCICSTNHCGAALEEMTGSYVEGEMVESVADGATHCIYRYHLKPTRYSSARGA